MELSQFTDYSLRVLIFTGLRQTGATEGDRLESLSSVREIAEAFQISQNHLVKVVHKLGQLGYIDTFRGRGGGISLAMAPEEIRVGTVVRQTENLAIVECLSSKSSSVCCIAPACELKRVLARARDAFLETLDGSTLADLLQPRNTLRKILQPSSPVTSVDS